MECWVATLRGGIGSQALYENVTYYITQNKTATRLTDPACRPSPIKAPVPDHGIMFFLRRSKPPLLGVDISSTSVKVVELAQSGANLQLNAYAIVALPAEETQGKDQSRIQIVGAAIRKAIRQMGTRLTRGITAVPSSAVIIKTVVFPATLREDDIEAQIELEAEQYIPYPLEDVSLDFCALGVSSRSHGLVDVQVVASRKEHVEDRAAALEWAGLKAEIVDVESFAMMRACDRIYAGLPDGRPEDAYAVIDAGAANTSLIVIEKGQVIFTRDQTFGGQLLSQEIQRRFGGSLEEAERLKRFGELPDGYETEVLVPFTEALNQQIERSLHFFRSSQPQVTLKRIFLSGGCAPLAAIDQLQASLLETPITKVEPFTGMLVNPRAARANLNQDAPALLVATGLALRGFD